MKEKKRNIYVEIERETMGVSRMCEHTELQVRTEWIGSASLVI
jgi:hypothetical protein